MTSSTVGHTPGPWAANGGTIQAGLKFIAVAGAPSDRDHVDLANARLIAAAPSLLEALEVARKWLVINDDRRSQSDIEVVEAAIAAAKGSA